MYENSLLYTRFPVEILLYVNDGYLRFDGLISLQPAAVKQLNGLIPFKARICYWKQISSKKHMDKTRGLLYPGRVEKRTVYGRSHNAGLTPPSISTYGGRTPRPTRTFENIVRQPIGTFGGTAPRPRFERFKPRPIGKLGRPVSRPNDAFASSMPHSTDTFGSRTSPPTDTFGDATTRPTVTFESGTLRPTGTFRTPTPHPNGTPQSAAKRPIKKSEGPTPSVSQDHRRSTYGLLSNKSSAPSTNKIRFDEEQIRQHLLFKDYDYLGIPEEKTPVPRPAEPVELGELRDRLVAILDCSSRKPTQVRYIDDDIEEIEDWRELRTLDFLEKRKAFYFQEFTIAKQKFMNSGVLSLPPGPSIGNNWTTGQQSLSLMRRISRTRTSTVNVIDKASSMRKIDPLDLSVSIRDMLASRINAVTERLVADSPNLQRSTYF
uniref:Uncharacterized protein n=1 Tax=Glossina austeni TaxID=7395 RepID=A0A1A9UEZ9_GLOAU